MPDEPEYLQKLRRAREQREQKSRPAPGPADTTATLSAAEQEAVRWARETARTELRAVRNLSGARFAVLVKVASASGVAFHTLEGLASREAALERVKAARAMGDDVLGAYEVSGGRPLAVGEEKGQPTFSAGAARAGAKPMSPEQMFRRAQAEAAERARSRPAERSDRDRGKGKSGGGGRG